MPLVNPLTMDVEGHFGESLTAKAFGLNLDFFYDSGSGSNVEFGRNRSSSVRCQVLSSTTGNRVTLVQGDFYPLSFTLAGSSGGITTYTGSQAPMVLPARSPLMERPSPSTALMV